jgi:endoglycosylceramidase
MEDKGYTKDENGDFLISDCQKEFFADYYTSPQSMEAFDALYNNKNQLQDKFVDFWDYTSKALTKNPYVIGFDPLNEPYPGDWIRNPQLLLPGYFDYYRLQPMYSRVFERYYNNDPDVIMFFEPSVWPDIMPYFGGVIRPVGFDTPPGGSFGSKNHVLNDHTYCCQLNLTVCASGEPSTDLAEECYAWHEKRIGTRRADADNLGLPLIISEFGACLTEASCTQEIRQVTEVSDQYLAGWAYWEFKSFEDLTTSAGVGAEGFYNKDGSLQDFKVKALSRTYLMATQGVLLTNVFDMDTSKFSATFKVDSVNIQKPSIIYTNRQYYYPNGYKTSVSVDGVELTSD